MGPFFAILKNVIIFVALAIPGYLLSKKKIIKQNEYEESLLIPLKYGTVSIAKKTNATIIPYAITGDYKFRSKNLRVVIGKPINIEKLTLEEANKKLEKEIGKLIKKGQAMD